MSDNILEDYSAAAHTFRHGICSSIFLRAVVDVTRLIPDARTVDEIMLTKCKAIIQADMFSQHPIDKMSSCNSANKTGSKCDDGHTLSCHR